MIAIPAIDLSGGACVQLVGGSFDAERVRIANPVTALWAWEAAGFSRVHVVDLDAATGRGDNRERIAELLSASQSSLQVGGGIRSAEDIDELLSAGANYVVVGTRAFEDLDWLNATTEQFPGKVIVAADVRDRRVTVRGWSKTLSLDISDAVAQFAPFQLGGILVTAVHVEGQMTGPDIALVDDVVSRATCPVIASGGIGSLDDLRALHTAGVSAAVIGMALYTGALDPRATAAEFGE